MIDANRQHGNAFAQPVPLRIEEDIADLKRLIHFLELRAYGAARRARAASTSTTAATAEALLRKLRASLNEASRLRAAAMASHQPRWAL